jgi:hypothetical protein
LPDDRVYEMVTPAENQDAEVYVPLAIQAGVLGGEGLGIATRLPFVASADGDAVVYVADPTSGGNGEGGLGRGEDYIATRLSGNDWRQANLQPPAREGVRYDAFSGDLSVGVLAATTGEDPLSGAEAPTGGYAALYTRSGEGSYHALFSVTPPGRVPLEFNTSFVGASADFSRVFFKANDALTADAVDGGAGEYNIYQSAGGRLSLVNVLPDGATEANAAFDAIDGSRVFWTDLNTDELFASEGVGGPSERTVQVDASQTRAAGGGGRFWAASNDGSKVLFTDSSAARLTSSTVSGSGVNLYEYDVPSGELTDLTPGREANVEGVVGASEDGEYVYFVASSVLSDDENRDHERAVAGRDNLYVLHGGASPVFIGTLSEEDGTKIEPYTEIEPFAEFGDLSSNAGTHTAEVSPDGESVVFMSDESLTGYRNVVEGNKIQEVFVYEADGDRLSCVSCDSSGRPPESNPESHIAVRVGAFLPITWGGNPWWMSDDGGRVFFDSGQPLSPEDTNGVQDVYEWERDGVGSCGTNGGCVYLLSGGMSSSASWLEGVSGSGDDVFFASRAQLVPEDGSEAFELYDARVDGVRPVLPPVCSGTGCQGVPPAPPVFATPASATFSGAGNFPAPVKAPVKAEKKHAKKRGKKHSTRAKRSRTRKKAKGGR